MTRHVQVLAFVVAVVWSDTGDVRAQVQPTPPPAAQSAAQPKPRIPLQVQVVISRYQGEKKISSAPYMMTVNANTLLDGGKPSSLRMGAEVPVPNPKFATVSADGKPGGGGPPQQYKAVGTNIDCSASSTDDGRFELNISIEDSSVYLSDQPSPGTPRVSDLPVFRSFRFSNELILRDGQSSQFTAATDRISGEVVKVDVTLTVVK